MEITPKKYKGVELTYTINEHKPNVDAKTTLSFALNGTTYKNAVILPLTATHDEQMDAIAKLDKWAKEIINDHQPKK